MILKDTVKELCSPKSLISEIDSIKSAFQQPVNYEAVFVRLSKAGKLYKPEIEEAKNILNESRIDDGIINRQETSWNLAQAISAVAKQQEETRERQLQEIAGELIA